MLFAVSGHFKAGGADTASHISFSDHVAQNVCRVHLGGPLYDAAGERIGVLLLVEAKDFDLTLIGRGRRRSAEGGEVRLAIFAQDTEFAVQDAVRQASGRAAEVRQPRRPVIAVAAEPSAPSARDAQLHAVAVELDLCSQASPVGGAATSFSC